MRRLPVLTALATALTSALVGAPLALAVAPDASGGDGANRADTSYSETKTLERTFVRPDGTVQVQSSNEVTVEVARTENLRGRQRVLVSWTGARPSGGRASNPFGEGGLAQEYPVVIMQCRGVENPTGDQEQLRRETCWTNSVAQRSQLSKNNGESLWRKDAFAAPADKERLSGLEPAPSSLQCPTFDLGASSLSSHLTPFVSALGPTFPACQSNQMPPEAAVDAAFPAAELAAFSDENGAGEVQFEVRSDVENESLGCNHETDCSIVVIPIVGLSCDQPSTPPTTADTNCRRTGRWAPGSSNFASQGTDLAVGPALWWSESNWRNRFSVPISFGLPPDTCDILDQRPPTGFYGTELLAQAALQWSPAYCLRQDRFKFQLNQMSDEAGWNLMLTGGGPAAMVSSQHENTGTDPVAYGPTAVTGFGIGYVIDKPENAGEVEDLKLNARLVAKLLTQSYLGSDLGRGHPGMGDNPLSIMQDQEFIELNPGLSQVSQEAGAALLSLSNSSDVIEQLTQWIASDEEAMAFVGGEEDPWGMVVNPNYQDLPLPTAEIPLLDDYVPDTGNVCRQENPGVYFSQLAAPVTTLRKISESILDAHPNVQTRCEFEPSTGLFRTGRIARQSYGSRFMLGVVSLGDAARYGIKTAALETRPGTFVGASEGSLKEAVKESESLGLLQPLALDQDAVRKSRDAYPGTMVVYTAARTQNLDLAEAEKVAQFMRVSTTEGQQPGSGNGELPDGFLPIRKSGPTAALYRQARAAADAVEAQEGIEEPTEEPDEEPEEPTDPPTDPVPPTGGSTPPTTDTGVPGVDTGGTGSDLGGDVPAAGDVPDEEPAPSDDAEPDAADDAAAAPVAMPATVSTASRVGGLLLPLLFLLGLIGAVGAVAPRFFVRPPKA